MRQARLAAALPFGVNEDDEGRMAVWLLLVELTYTEGEAETYAIPVAWAAGGRAAELAAEHPNAVVARLRTQPRGGGGEARAESGILYDALVEPAFARFLLGTIAGKRAIKGPDGEIVGVPAPPLAALRAGLAAFEPHLGRAEQSNSSVLFGDQLILKLFRKVEPGVNPDLEIGRFLAAQGFEHTPPLAGWLELRRGRV